MSDLPDGALIGRRSRVYEIVFAAGLLTLAASAFFALCMTSGRWQDGIFNGDNDFFMDFFNVLKYISGRDPYHNDYRILAEKAYPPLCYLLLYPFSMLWNYAGNVPKDARSDQLGLMSVVVFLVVCSVVLFLLLFKMKKGTDTARFFTAAALLCSGVMIFSLERANSIFIAAPCVVFFLLCRDSPRRAVRELALVALAVAAAIKIYPAVLGVLLLYEKRWREALRLAVYGLAAFFLPFFFFTGGLANLPQLLSNVRANTSYYLMRGIVYRFGFVPVGILLGGGRPAATVISMLSYLPALLAVATAWRLDRGWKTVMLLTCALMATPANSAFYCGLYLFPAAVMFLNDRAHRRGDWFYLLALVVIFNPFQIEIGNVSWTTAAANFALLAVYLWLLAQASHAFLRGLRRKQAAAA